MAKIMNLKKVSRRMKIRRSVDGKMSRQEQQRIERRNIGNAKRGLYFNLK